MRTPLMISILFTDGDIWILVRKQAFKLHELAPAEMEFSHLRQDILSEIIWATAQLKSLDPERVSRSTFLSSDSISFHLRNFDTEDLSEAGDPLSCDLATSNAM